VLSAPSRLLKLSGASDEPSRHPQEEGKGAADEPGSYSIEDQVAAYDCYPV
jgi:hypothetical protein